MPRLIPILLVLLPLSAGTAASQVAICGLAARPYGFGDLCRLASPPGETTPSLRLPIRDSVRIWTTAGPQDPPPWRGNLALRATDVAFETAKAGGGPGPVRLVFRTGLTRTVLSTALERASAEARSR